MGDLSRDFSAAEFNCRHCGRRRGPTPALVAVLQRLRDSAGRPLRVVSGYRCPDHNDAVGGATRSRHMSGDAADIPRGLATLQQAWDAGAVGVGTSGRWATHVDTRPGPRRHWRYS